MNCKQGDLAVVIRPPQSKPEWLGRIVKITEPSKRKPGWWAVEPGPWKRAICIDANLRPIRDQPGDDETLTWAGKPEKVAG